MKEKGLGSSKVSGIKVLPFYLLAFLLFIVSGCIEEYEADISAEDSNLLVVEGAICSSTVNTFILSRTQAINSTYTPKMVTGAKVSVYGSDGSKFMTQETDGHYSCQMDALSPDVEYYLHIEVDGDVYESEPQKPLRTENIIEVKGVQDNPESNIDVLLTSDVPFESGKPGFYLWTYVETWEVHPDYTTFLFFDVKTMQCVFMPNQFPARGWKNVKSPANIVGENQKYEGQQIRNLKLYEIDRSDERMYYRYSGLIRQRAISKEEYEYELARRQASSEMGGLFTPQPSSLPTNIHCLTSDKHVIGFIGCALNTSEYRFFLDRDDYSIYVPPRKDARTWLNDCTEGECCVMADRGYFLCEWEDNRPGGPLRTAWAYDYQLDVRLRGATAEEPEFWEN